MPSLAEDRLALDGVYAMTQQRSGGRWRSSGADRSATHDEVIPRNASAPSGRDNDQDTAVRMLYEQHAGPLLMFALVLTGDRQIAEDVVQQTLLRAWCNTHRLRAKGQPALRPWLHVVVRQIATDDHRGVRRDRAVTYGQQLESFPRAIDDTDRRVQPMVISRALRELGQVHREILIETYFRGRTVPEVAAALNVPINTVKLRLCHALRALRTLLQAGGTP